MADLKISQLDSVTAAASDSVIPIVQGGVTKKILVSNLTNEYIRKAEHSVISIGTTQVVNLSTTFSLNIIKVSASGLTLTIQFPTSPVEGQVCEFTTLSNTVTLVVGTGGSFSVEPSFASAPAPGFVIAYVYHETDDTWYKISS
tara:strand:+ start:200 stop:631 length:432 start_codon:yes stop_codon:yes gene_type:complete